MVLGKPQRAKGVTKRQYKAIREKSYSSVRRKAERQKQLAEQIKDISLTSQERKAILESGAVPTVQPTERGYIYTTAASEKTARMLESLTRQHINKLNVERQKYVNKAKTPITAKGVEDLLTAQKAIKKASSLRENAILARQLVNKIVSDPKALLSPARIGDYKMQLRKYQIATQGVIDTSDFVSRASQIINLAERRLTNKKQPAKRTGNTVSKFKPLTPGEKFDAAITKGRARLSSIAKNTDALSKVVVGSVIIGAARGGVGLFQIGKTGYTLGKTGVGLYKRDPTTIAKTISFTKSLDIKKFPKALGSTINEELVSFSRNPIAYASEVIVLAGGLKIVGGGIKTVMKLIKKATSATVKTAGSYLNKAGVQVSFEATLNIGKNGIGKLKLLLRPGGKAAKAYARTIRIASGLYGKFAPSIVKKASEATLIKLSSIRKALADIKLYNSISVYNTNSRIKNISTVAFKNIKEAVKDIKRDIKTNRITRKTVRNIKFIKDDLKRFNLDLRLKLGRLKLPKLTLPTFPKFKLNPRSTKYLSTIIKTFEDIKLYKGIAKYNTKIRVKNITTKAYNTLQKPLRAVRTAVKNNKVTEMTLREIKNIKLKLRQFNLELKLDISLLKSKIRGKITKVKTAIDDLRKLRLTPFNMKYMKRIIKTLEDLKLYKNVARYNTRSRISTIKKVTYGKIRKNLTTVKSAFTNNKVTQNIKQRLQFIKDDLRRFNIKITYNMTTFKKKLSTKIKTKYRKIAGRVDDFLTSLEAKEVVAKKIKKYKLPTKKQIKKNLRLFGQPDIDSKGRYWFKNKITGDIRKIKSFTQWYNATVKHGRFLRSVEGKRLLRKLAKNKTRAGRLKAAKVERLWAKEDALKRKGRISKAKRTLTKKQRKLIKKKAKKVKKIRPVKKKVAPPFVKKFKQPRKTNFRFKNLLTGDIRYYKSAKMFRKAVTQHHKYLNTKEGKRLLRKLAKEKTRPARLKLERERRMLKREAVRKGLRSKSATTTKTQRKAFKKIKVRPVKKKVAPPFVKKFKQPRKTNFRFKNLITGEIRYYKSARKFRKAVVRHNKYLNTKEGKKLLRKLAKKKTRSTRLKLERERRMLKREASKQIPKAKRTLTKAQRKAAKRSIKIRRRVKRKILIRGGISIQGIDNFFKVPAVIATDIVSGSSKTNKKFAKKINEFITKPSKPSEKLPSGASVTKEGEIIITEEKLKKPKVKVKPTIKEKPSIPSKERIKGLPPRRQIRFPESKILRPSPFKILEPIMILSPVAKVLGKIKPKIKTSTKVRTKATVKTRAKVKATVKAKPISKIKAKQKLTPRLAQRLKLSQAQKVKQKAKQKLAQKIKSVLRTTKKKLKLKKPIKIKDDWKPSKKAKKIVDSISKEEQFAYIPDLASLMLGTVATKKEGVRLIKPGRYFSGLETRKIVR